MRQSLIVGIDPGIRTGGCALQFVSDSGFGPVELHSWAKTWESQGSILDAVEVKCRAALEAGIAVVVQGEAAFFTVVKDKHGRMRPANTDGIEDHLQSLGAWRDMARRVGASWCPPVLYSTWAGSITGLKGTKATKKACSRTIALLVEKALPGVCTNEHKRDAYCICRWRAEQHRAGALVREGKRRVSRKADGWRNVKVKGRKV